MRRRDKKLFMKRKNLGVMLDCSRNAVMNTDTLKQFIILLEKLGYNFLELYTEDTYEIEGEPYFGRLRGGYKKTELKEIDAFCKSHGIELIPCIQTLGHLEKIFEWSAYADVHDADGILLAEEEKTYALIEKMFATVSECFTSRKINIGMDEAHTLGLGNYLKKHGYRNRFEIYLKHLNRVAEIAKKYGFKPAIWSDMFFRIASGGEYISPEAVIPEEVKRAVPENVELIYWDYFSKETETYEKMLSKHFEFNRKVWFAGSAVKCTGFNSCNEISIDRTEKAFKACDKLGVSDVIMTLWSDGGAECSPFAVLPTLVYASCCNDGVYDVNAAKERFYEVTGENFDDFMLCDLSRLPFARVDDIGTGAKEMLYGDYFCGRFNECVSLTGKECATYAGYAERFLQAKKRSKIFKYLFDFYYRLTCVLADKYDLARLTREYYRNQNLEGLKSLLQRYDAVIKKLPPLIKSFSALWEKENKTFGFEVHELRLGGLLQRTKGCMVRLTEYVSGVRYAIEELETPELTANPIMPFCNSYARLATVNRLI